jgi:hypothetical protein
MKGKAEKATLEALGNQAAYIQEKLIIHGAVGVEDLNESALFHYKQALIAGMGYLHRIGKAVGHHFKIYRLGISNTDPQQYCRQ